MFTIRELLCVSLVSVVISSISCANILAVIPAVSKSHHLVFEPLIGELIKKHAVTVITNFPQSTHIVNVTEINVMRSYEGMPAEENIFSMKLPITTDKPNFFLNIDTIENVLLNKDVLDLMASDSTFDLIIQESFGGEDLLLGFSHRFDAPVISMSTIIFPWMEDRLGIPANPSFVPKFASGYSTNMSFFERFWNSMIDLSYKIHYAFFLEPKFDNLLRKHFGENTPSLQELGRNIGLHFVTTPQTIFGAQPYPPNVVDVGGLHLEPVKTLYQDLDQWMNESSEGVIYFSFGSMLRGASLPMDKVNAFLQAFEGIPQRVLWKWEDNPVKTLPKNVKIMKWLPQRDILAHPKVKVFISHGGLLGTTEAVDSGVPILGIPMYGDQPNNVAALVEKKVAIHVDYNNISVASLSYALNTLINDKSYLENAKKLSGQFKDRPQSPLDTAVYWTEYVIRHKGAPHLQSAAVHLPWYQYYLLDVIAVLTAALLVLLAFVYYTIKSCLRLVLPKKTSKLKRS